VRDCLAGDGVIALAQLEPGWETNYYERPGLQPICCAGVLVWHEALEGGRYNIVLQGAARIRVLDELPAAHAYREVRAELLADPPYQGPEEELVRQAVLELSARVPAEVGDKVLQLAMRASGGGLADVVASTVVSDIETRQRLLCELDPRTRLRKVLGEVGDVINRLPSAKPSGPMN
jgi:uncharacterized protein